MKSAAVTDLKNQLSYYLRLVARGETVQVLDRGNPVAEIRPIGPAEAGFRKLAAEGVVTLPSAKVPTNFWARALPVSNQSVTEALLEDRNDRF